MKEFKQLGAYGLIIQDGKILLIKKFGGPYDGKLDLPGGTIEFYERPEEALKRELIEEVGIEVVDCQLFDADSVAFEWQAQDLNAKSHTHKKMSSRSSWLLGRCIIIAALKLPMGLSRFRYQETILAFFVLYRCHFLLNILWFLEFLMLCISSYFVNRGSKVTFLCRKQDSL